MVVEANRQMFRVRDLLCSPECSWPVELPSVLSRHWSVRDWRDHRGGGMLSLGSGFVIWIARELQLDCARLSASPALCRAAICRAHTRTSTPLQASSHMTLDDQDVHPFSIATTRSVFCRLLDMPPAKEIGVPAALGKLKRAISRTTKILVSNKPFNVNPELSLVNET